MLEVTDDACGVGQPPTAHLVCEYDDCPGEAGLDFECDVFSAPPL